jgi:hypothetical protein
MPSVTPKTAAPNTLIFTNNLTGEEVSIGSSTIVSADTGMSSTPALGIGGVSISDTVTPSPTSHIANPILSNPMMSNPMMSNPMMSNPMMRSNPNQGSSPYGGMPGNRNTQNPTGTSSSDANAVTLPVWAYMVRANTLRLDQEQLIFRIGKTAAIGVTFTKTDGAFVATDIVLASFEPLATNAHNLDLSGAKTQLGIGLGASYKEVLTI